MSADREESVSHYDLTETDVPVGAGNARLAQAVEQAVQSVGVIWEGDGGRAMLGDLSGSKIVGYRVGAKEWEHLIAVCREMSVADV